MSLDTSIDGHVHTSLCRHAVGTMEEYVLAAIDKGLKKLIFLEHMEEGIAYFERTWLTEEEFDYYFEEGKRLQQHYGGRIEIGLGVEVGYNPECADILVQRLKQRNWDRVGLSHHFCRLEGYPEHLNLLSSKQSNIRIFLENDSGKLLSRYFDTLIEAVQKIPADVLCHLDAGLRYCPDLTLGQRHLEQIDTLLDLVKKSGMMLEINASGYKNRNEPYPRTDIISRAVNRGIQITAGSDAHSPKDVSRYFSRIAAL